MDVRASAGSREEGGPKQVQKASENHKLIYPEIIPIIYFQEVKIYKHKVWSVLPFFFPPCQQAQETNPPVSTPIMHLMFYQCLSQEPLFESQS